MTNPGQRDRAWLEALFAAHHRQVLAYVLRRLPPHEADDVLSEVFAAAWQHRQRVPDPALPWLYRVASNTVLHAQRSHSRRTRLVDRWQAEAQGTQEDHAEAADGRLDDKVRVDAAMAKLSVRDAEILRLSVWEDLDLNDLAFVLGCTTTAAKVRLHRARRRFSAALEAPGPPVLATRTEVTA